MQALLLGLAALALALIALNAFTRANPSVVATNMRRILGGLAVIAAVFLFVRGAIGAALPLAVIGLWLITGRDLGGAFGSAGGSAPLGGRTSRITTDHLEMELDLDTGDMQGRILKGFFAGRSIENLRPVELAHLWQDCRFTDPQSAQLVEAYLDRIHPSWREDMARAEADAPKDADGRMPRDEALEILGLGPEPTEDDIRRAHRELIRKLHPDRGGSTYLAAKINEAKDVLLATRPQ